MTTKTDIDREAILKFAGFKWNRKYHEYYSPSGEPSGEPNIFDLNLQAKYLWPKLFAKGYELKILGEDGYYFVHIIDANSDEFKEIGSCPIGELDCATAILLAVQELLND